MFSRVSSESRLIPVRMYSETIRGTRLTRTIAPRRVQGGAAAASGGFVSSVEFRNTLSGMT